MAPQTPPSQTTAQTETVLTSRLPANIFILRAHFLLAVPPRHQEGGGEVAPAEPHPGQLHALHQTGDPGAADGEDSEREGDADQTRGHPAEPGQVLGVLRARVETLQHQLSSSGLFFFFNTAAFCNYNYDVLSCCNPVPVIFNKI